MTKYIYTILVLACMTIFSHLNAQTASIQTGCIPLNVQFTGPSSSEYFWDFDDGTNSTLQNPEHVFTSAGDFEVQLFTSQGGTLVGEILITVYPDLIVEIEADVREGCLPLEVTFTPTITQDDEVSITGYLWTFDDGGSSTDLSPTYTYSSDGVYDVSLKVITSIGECDKVQIFEEYITVTGVEAKFVSNKFSSCSSPDIFTFTNQTEEVLGNIYSWDFGNGETFDSYQPPPITYSEDGVFPIILTVTSANGCVSTAQRNINIGPPIITFNFSDGACINNPFFMNNATIADEHIWDFGNNPDISVINPEGASPVVEFLDFGDYEISYSAVSFLGCTADTTFTINVEPVNSNFTIGPEVTCGENFTIILEAEELNHASYTWIEFNDDGTNLVTTSSIQTDEYEAPTRDSFYVNYPDILHYELLVTSQDGCTNTAEGEYIIRKPEAYFIPDQLIGIAPMTVTFDELSYSQEDIVLWEWDFGDGTTESFDTAVDPTHTYTSGGIYYVRLTITNEAGCIDSSELIAITVFDVSEIPLSAGGGPPSVSVNGIAGDIEICVNDTIEVVYQNPATDLLDFHFYTDDGRFNHCWEDDEVAYVLPYPGVFEMTYIIEYEGFVLFEGFIGELTVLGAHAKIGYETDCDDIYNVEFESKSLNANDFEWFIDGEMASSAESFSHTFTDLGRHEIELRVDDTNSPCGQHIDTTSVYITDIKADFEVPQNMCDSTFYLLDASASLDVHDSCHEGYLWNFDFHRPREVGEDSLYHQFPAGRQKIKLTTEDINGCKDSLTKWVNVYGITPDFPIDSSICLPHTYEFMDASQSDTTIVEWDWTFGSTEENTEYTFFETDTTGFPIVGLMVTDAIGCTDTISKEYEIYEIMSNVSINRGPRICVGSSIEFEAEDFNQAGSFLNFEWEFGADGSLGTSNEPNPEFTFNEAGETEVTLTFTEQESGCMGDTTLVIEAFPEPIAGFTTNADTLDVICHPETIEFTNTSITSGPTPMSWDFGNGASSNDVDPAITYDKGIYTTTLIARSIYGCADTISRSFELVGPEGMANIDKSTFCIGEEIMLSISDTVDVNSFTWDLGDGVTIDDQAPLTYVYESTVDTTIISLILRTTETGCEIIETIPINIQEVLADFEIGEQEGICGGIFNLENLSIGATSYNWSFEDQTSSSENPEFNFSTPGIYDVSLTVSDTETGCEHTAIKEIEIIGEESSADMPNVFSPNGDGRNDFFNVITEDPANQEFVDIIEFKIYNRWGNLIYDNDIPMEGWNGNIDGKLAPAEVYSYYIEYSVNGCANKNVKGNITLIR